MISDSTSNILITNALSPTIHAPRNLAKQIRIPLRKALVEGLIRVPMPRISVSREVDLVAATCFGDIFALLSSDIDHHKIDQLAKFHFPKNNHEWAIPMLSNIVKCYPCGKPRRCELLTQYVFVTLGAFERVDTS